MGNAGAETVRMSIRLGVQETHYKRGVGVADEDAIVPTLASAV